MKEYIPIRSVLLNRIIDPHVMQNECKSPITDLLNTCYTLNVMPLVREMVFGAKIIKARWKQIVWDSAWSLEITEWFITKGNESSLELLDKVMIGRKATMLKDDECRLKGQPIGSRMCISCDLGALEKAIHMLMQCPKNAHHRQSMCNEISEIYPDIDPQEFLNIVMGKCIEGLEYEQMLPIWEVSAKYVNMMYMYFDTLRSRHRE